MSVSRETVRRLLEAHAGQKTVHLELERPVDECLTRLGGFTFTRTGEHGVTIELPRSLQVQAALARLVAELPVRDLSVESLSLERVIKAIYEQARTDADAAPCPAPAGVGRIESGVVTERVTTSGWDAERD